MRLKSASEEEEEEEEEEEDDELEEIAALSSDDEGASSDTVASEDAEISSSDAELVLPAFFCFLFFEDEDEAEAGDDDERLLLEPCLEPRLEPWCLALSAERVGSLSEPALLPLRLLRPNTTAKTTNEISTAANTNGKYCRLAWLGRRDCFCAASAVSSSGTLLASMLLYRRVVSPICAAACGAPTRSWL